MKGLFGQYGSWARVPQGRCKYIPVSLAPPSLAVQPCSTRAQLHIRPCGGMEMERQEPVNGQL